MGKRKREGQGTYLGPWLEQGDGGAGWPREQARWAERDRGGGAAAARKGLARVEAVVGGRGGALGFLYRAREAVGGSSRDGGGSVLAGERRGAP